uniref:MARVEL domain-containing protein n=1 Tax=Globodera pallida TaxID=36090 RepID=A0A183BSH0_GLOPA
MNRATRVPCQKSGFFVAGTRLTPTRSQCLHQLARKEKPLAAHVPSYWRRSRLHRICDFVYATAAFPVGMASCLMFWALYVADPDLVMPAWVAKLVPNWLNHVSHTAPVAFVLVDTLLTCHHAPDRKVGSAVVAALFFCYVGIIFAARFLNGVWLYPIFDRLSNQQIAGLFSTAGALFWFLYLIGDGLNMALWGKAPHSVDDGIKQQQTGKKLRAD